MADKKVTPVKKTESVREQAAKQQTKARQPRRLRQTASSAKRPVQLLGKLIKKILRPLSFVLLPFKTRPMRFIGRVLATVLLLSYFKRSWQELRKVNWPDFKQTAKLTFAVLIFTVVFGFLILVVDYGIDKLFRKVLL